MNIYEYQAKHLFKQNNIPTPNGFMISDISQIDSKIRALRGNSFVIKAQIKAGGRGQAGGVKIVKGIDEAKKIAKELLGTRLVTKQTSSKGELVKSVYIEKCASIDKQYYFCITIDRALDCHSIIASCEGGVDIEEVSKNTPQKIIKIPLDPFKGLCDNIKNQLVKFLKIKQEHTKSFIQTITNCYEFYMQNDASLLEINPLVKISNIYKKNSIIKNNDFVALDAKISFDKNALFRHAHINDLDELSEDEEYCKTRRLAYIALDGEIGCMVNGAGLAMATMDEIQNVKGDASAANFLDVGGGAKEEAIIKGFEFIVKNKKVKSIFVNIFGGIVRCDIIAKAIIKATDIKNISIPIVVRLDGTNSKEGMALLKESNLSQIINANSLEDGAIKAIKASKATQN